MLKRFLLFSGIAVALGGVVVISVLSWTRSRENLRLEEFDRIYSEAGDLLAVGRSTEALSLLEVHFQPSLARTVLSSWPSRMVEAASVSRNYGHLEHLLGQYPSTLLENEAAALWWVRAQMHRRFWDAAEDLVAEWPENSRAMPYRWKLLEADQLLLRGDEDGAYELLSSWSSEGATEVNRQLRIALLAGDDTDAIHEALRSAYRALPTSPDLRATSAQFLERAGALAEARREYIAAFLLAPENPFHGDQLAQFYLRTLALPQALETWRQSFEQTGDPRAWWNVWFWERVTVARGDRMAPRFGDWWGNLGQKLSQTGTHAFLPEELFFGDVPSILAGEEAFHWLLVFEALRRGQEADALEHLESMPLAPVPLAEDLRTVLMALLDWRVRGDWPRDVVLSRGSLNHRFIRFLGEFHPAGSSKDLDSLGPIETFLLSDIAIAAVVLANGWLGAADRLFPESFPDGDFSSVNELDWLPFAFCKAKAQLEGPDAALVASRLFSGDDAVRGLTAEMLLAVGQVDEGIRELEALVDAPSGAGFRAAYLYAMALLDRKDFGGLDDLMLRRAELAESVSGKELRARSAQLKGDLEKAVEIYESLGAESVEGTVYRYRAALFEGDTAMARSHLETLIELAPNEPRFREWMSAIDRTAAAGD